MFVCYATAAGIRSARMLGASLTARLAHIDHRLIFNPKTGET
jgi:hypothetical protein